tara:strand:+ start:44 stop:592 length:549 start_codon:yes stop_codon:yes gene_type:complete
MIKKKKPMAARGKTTRKGKVVKALKSVFTGVKPKVSMKTKAKQMQALMRKMNTASPGMKKAITGSAAGMGGAGLLALARRIKSTGRLNAADMERVKKMMGKKTGGKMTRTEFQAMFDKIAKDKVKSPPGKKPVLDSQGKPVENLFQKDDRLKRRRMIRQRTPDMPGIGRRPGIRKRKNVFKK